jgi:regulator of protease activity HflC (stomatin/prohibitin superfamily)
MKPLSIFIVSCFTALSVFAQNNITVTVTLNGNLNREILIDGNSYLASDYASTSEPGKNMITVSDLTPGQHTLQVVRTTANNTRRNIGTERIFNLRQGYDLDIVVNGNGAVQLTEKRTRNRGRNNTGTHTAMTSANYNILVRDISRLSTTSARVTAINTAFTNTANYFTTAQISQLVRMVTGDANRIQLLKASYRSVTDRASFYTLYPLVATRAGRDDVAAYVDSYSSSTTTPYPGTGVGGAMTNANFNQLLTQVRNEYSAEGRVNTIYNAFSNTGNYFSTEQVRRLIQLITGEANMLHLAKASYRSVVDKNNFQTIYNLIPTQAGRNDLANYVNTYNPNVVYSGSISGSTTSTVRTAMSSAEFSNLLTQIRGQWLPGAKKTAVINAFNVGNYFTTAQAAQLIQLDNDEPDRLDMAKASYKTIVDPANFSQVYTLFSTKAYRDELVVYVNNYSSTGSTSTGSTYRTAMAENEFNTLLNNIRGQWLPGAKKAAVINEFTTSGHYFTSVQASQLIQLDNDEPDRLDMAKASYKVVVDPANFDVVYNLFTTQSYRDALSVYVNANR